MSNSAYMTGMWILILVVTLPQIIGTYLCFEWMQFPRRRWMRMIFLVGGAVSCALLIFRVAATLLFSDVLTAMFVVAISGVLMHFLTTGILYACTRLFKKRFNAVKAGLDDDESTTAILQTVIDDLVIEGRKRRLL